MKSLFHKFTLILPLVALTACSSDDHEPAPEPTLAEHIYTPNIPTASRVASIEYAGVFGRTFNWTFSYDSKSLTKATRTEKNGNATQSIGASVDYTLTYTPQNVIVKSSDKAVTLDVKKSGLLESMTCGDETCTYTYSDNKLIRWESKFVLDGKTDDEERYSYGDIVWENGNIKTIKFVPFTEADHKFYTYELTYDESQSNDNGVMPELISKAMGIEGVEFLYYSGMLGKATTNLAKSIKITHSTDNTQNESYNFMYRRSNSNITYCNYTSTTEINNVPNKNVVVTYRYN